MPAERDLSIEIPEGIRDEVQKIIDLLSESLCSDDEKMEIINLGDMDNTPEEMEMMALLHFLRKGLPMHEAEKEAKKVVRLQLEIEKEFAEQDRAKQSLTN